jgi:GNAT superfamily N-acetyltransferase
VSKYVIRDASDGDRDRIVELTERAYAEFEHEMDENTWRGFSHAMRSVLSDPGDAHCIVADDDGRLLGSVFYFATGTRAYGNGDSVASPEFRLLAVAPNARGRGVGRALIDECIRRARAEGAAELGLHTSKSFKTALAMYQKLGFTHAPDRDFHPENAEVVEGYRLAL